MNNQMGGDKRGNFGRGGMNNYRGNRGGGRGGGKYNNRGPGQHPQNQNSAQVQNNMGQ